MSGFMLVIKEQFLRGLFVTCMLRGEDHDCNLRRKTWKKAEVTHIDKLNHNPSRRTKAANFIFCHRK